MEFVYPWNNELDDEENLLLLEQYLNIYLEENYPGQATRMALSFPVWVWDEKIGEERLWLSGENEALPQPPLYISRFSAIREEQLSNFVNEMLQYVDQYDDMVGAVDALVNLQAWSSGVELTDIAFIIVYVYPSEPPPINLPDAVAYGAHGVLPTWLTSTPSVYPMGGERNSDGLCFFRCLAVALGRAKNPQKCTDAAKKLVKESGIETKIREAGQLIGLNYAVTNDMIEHIEKVFEVNINMFTNDNGVTYQVRHSRENENIVNLYAYVYEDQSTQVKRVHLSLIHDLQGFTKTFPCTKCSRIFEKRQERKKHEEECDGESTLSKFPKDVYFVPPRGTLLDFLQSNRSDILNQLHEMMLDFIVLEDLTFFTRFEKFTFNTISELRIELLKQKQLYENRWKHIHSLVLGKTQQSKISNLTRWSRRMVIVEYGSGNNDWNDIQMIDHKGRFIETKHLLILDIEKMLIRFKKDEFLNGKTLNEAIRSFHNHFLKSHISIFHDVITLPKALLHIMFSEIPPRTLSLPENMITYNLLKDGIIGGMGQINRHLVVGGRIESYDCTSMYAYALAQPMPCGLSKYKRLNQDEATNVIERIQSDKFIGFIRCNVFTPENLREKYSDLPLIVNKGGFNTFNGDHVVIWSRLARYYLKCGLTIVPFESLEYETAKPIFSSYVQRAVSDRIDADKTKNIPLIQIQKFKLSAAHGVLHMNKSCNPDVIVCNLDQSYKHVNDKHFVSMKKINDDTVSIRKTKSEVLLDQPIQVASAIYAESKLHFFEFYYDFLKPNFNFEPLLFQTDAVILSLTKPTLLDCLHTEIDVSEWLSLSDDTKRVPGLFHLEKQGCNFSASGINRYSVTSEELKPRSKPFKNRKRIINEDGITTSPFQPRYF